MPEDWERWLEDEARANLPRLREASVFLQIVPDGDPDPRMALQLGYALLLGKPLLFVVAPGRTIPDGLALAADAFVDWDDDPNQLQLAIRIALEGILDD